jgi:hypothetical protein
MSMTKKDLIKSFIRESLIKEGIPVTSISHLKPGMKIRHTGEFDPEMPAIAKVLSVKGDSVTLGDPRGRTIVLTGDQLRQGGWVTEMKLGVAGRHSFATVDDEVDAHEMGPMLGGSDPRDEIEDLSCPGCGAPPGESDPMCPDCGDGDLDPRDPDRKHDDY